MHQAVGIIGSGYYVPERIVSNIDLENMLDTTDEWIWSRTGIRERRIAANNQVTSDLAVAAGQKALLDSGIEAGEIDLVIVATMTPDMPFPATACIIQKKLGLSKAVAFDLSAACSGFIYGVSVAQQYLQNGTYRTALVIGAEEMSRILDWKDRNTCVLFGDGAGAVVLQAGAKEREIISVHLGTDGSGCDLLKMTAGGSLLPASHETIDQRLHFLQMNGKEIYKYAAKAMAESTIIALNKIGLSPRDIDILIPHQANIRILEGLAERLKYPLSNVYVNISKYGNTSAASIPIALVEAEEAGMLKRDDIVLLTGFGAGFTWGTCVIKW